MKSLSLDLLLLFGCWTNFIGTVLSIVDFQCLKCRHVLMLFILKKLATPLLIFPVYYQTHLCMEFSSFFLPGNWTETVLVIDMVQWPRGIVLDCYTKDMGSILCHHWRISRPTLLSILLGLVNEYQPRLEGQLRIWWKEHHSNIWLMALNHMQNWWV